MIRRALAGVLVLAAALLAAGQAHAQLNGENLLGDMGVRSGTQPEPGFYVSAIYYRYDASSIRDAEGHRLSLDPTGQASQTINAGIPLIYYVTPKKILGANFAMMAVVPVAKGALEAPGFGFSEGVSAGLSDLYVMPAQLGWHFKRADAIAGVAFFAPTGRYTAGATDNLGKGMWSVEASAGATVYVDSTRTISVATTAYYETHTKKSGDVRVRGLTLDEVRVGDLLTLEGGVGKSFLHGAATFGAAYYAQWKVTSDDLGVSNVVAGPDGIPGHHRIFGFGPDVTVPIATKSRLIALVNARYYWEQGARLKTQGDTLLITTTFPLGGIKVSH